MRIPRGLASLAPLIGLLWSMTASAETVTVNIVNPLDPGLGSVHGDTLNFSFNGVSETASYVGAFNTNIVLNNQTSGTFDSYCIDLYHGFGGPITQWTATTSTTWNVGGNSDPSNPGVAGIGGALAYLVNHFDPTVVNAPNLTTARLNAAALQIALWSVEYNGLVATDDPSNLDGNGNTKPGRFYFGHDNSVNPGLQNQVYALANADIAAITNTSETANFFLSIRDAASQDLIAASTSFNPAALVPEPSSVILIALGLGAVALRARRARPAA